MAEKPTNPPRRPSISFVDDISQQSLHKQNASLTVPPGERRQSIWNNARKSIYGRRLSHSFSQGSRKSSQDLLPRIRLQNTYRTEPNENEKFKPHKIEPRLYELLAEQLKNKAYDPNKSAILSKDISHEIMRETRLLMNNNSSRYKLISHVMIGEMKNQDIRYGSRCLWDNNLDNQASVVYKNSSLYAVATVFAVYFE